MARVDRLSALISRFEVTVSLVASGSGNLVVLGTAQKRVPLRIVFCPAGCVPEVKAGEAVLVEAWADLGGSANPLVTSLPAQLSLEAEDDDDETSLILRLLLAEANAMRCGAGSVLSRLAEVLIIRLLRSAIEHGETQSGLLAGLSDTRISRAIVAMHDKPGREWRNEELADIAGLSLSRFAEVFQAHLGEAPQSYLRRWRMTLARQDIERGDRVKAVSRRYGYASSEAFGRAFQKQYGQNPLSLRGNIAMPPSSQ